MLNGWTLTTLVSLLLAQADGSSGAPDAGATRKADRPKAPSINVPTFSALPKADGATQPAAEKPASHPSAASFSATYSIVKVQHAKTFVRSPAGLLAMGGNLDAIPLSGKPPATAKFTTAVRVKSPQRANAPIDLTILDPRGDTAMSASGELSFRTVKGDEVDYLVDWDPVPLRGGGDFQVLIRVAGQPMGTWPLKVVEQNK